MCQKPNICVSCAGAAVNLPADDPAGASHVEPGEVSDESLTVTTYERTPEQAKALGLSAGAEGTEGGSAPAEGRDGGAAQAGGLNQASFPSCCNEV